MKYQLITPEKVISSGEANSISLPTRSNGYITILEHHMPLISSLGVGELVVTHNGEEKLFVTDGGFVEITASGDVKILTDYASAAEHLNEAEIEAAQARAANLIHEHKTHDDITNASLVASLERELAKLKVVRKHRAR